MAVISACKIAIFSSTYSLVAGAAAYTVNVATAPNNKTNHKFLFLIFINLSLLPDQST